MKLHPSSTTSAQNLWPKSILKMFLTPKRSAYPPSGRYFNNHLHMRVCGFTTLNSMFRFHSFRNQVQSINPPSIAPSIETDRRWPPLIAVMDDWSTVAPSIDGEMKRYERGCYPLISCILLRNVVKTSKNGQRNAQRGIPYIIQAAPSTTQCLNWKS